MQHYRSFLTHDRLCGIWPVGWHKAHGGIIISRMIRSATPAAVADRKPPIIPGWAIPRGPVSTDLEAAFMAGATLNSLDMLVRSDPAWAGAWRQRLALKCAVAAVRLAGRIEDEAALRDVWTLRPSGTDPSAVGPAGGILSAWRRLGSKSTDLDTDTPAGIVEMLGLRWSDDFFVYS
jgi:hypothetical protein